jgi:hypothetical protein
MVAGFIDVAQVNVPVCSDPDAAAEAFYKIRQFSFAFPQNMNSVGCPGAYPTKSCKYW